MDGYITIGTKIDTKDAERDINSLVDYLKYAEERAGRELTKQEKKQLEEIYWNAQELGMKIKQGLNQAADGLKNTGNSIKKVIKNVVRWGLAVFSIRGAYMAVRSAINTIAGDDEQLKADIDYMKNAIAYTLEPVVRRIVDLAKQLLFYIGYLIKEWTGYNIFENANKSLKKSVGSAKELKKQLTGFDEMNVLSDSSSSGGGGGVSPSFDLTTFEGMETPGWLVTIKDIGQWIIDNWEDVVMQLLLVKLVIDLLTGNWLGVVIDFIGFLILAIPKLWDAIQAVVDNTIIILGMIMGWINTNVITPLKQWFAKLWENIVNGVTNAVKWVKDKFQSIVSFFSNLISKIVSLFKTIGTKVGDAIGGAFKTVVNGVLKAVESILNFPIKSINKLINKINDVPGINLSTLPTFKFPRLAKGGIINMPGRGIPVGSAVGGEKGQEGVIPLTDSQQMALLGEAIGKYININATVPVYVGNRMVAREMKRIEAEDNFAYNR